MSRLTHFDAKGRAVMVDVSDKAETERLAIARGRVTMRPATLRLILGKNVKKGDVLTVAQLAGIAGAKRTPDLVPLCHPLALTSVKVELTPVRSKHAIDIEARVEKLAHARFDGIGQLARHDDQGLFSAWHCFSPRVVSASCRLGLVSVPIGEPRFARRPFSPL